MKQVIYEHKVKLFGVTIYHHIKTIEGKEIEK